MTIRKVGGYGAGLGGNTFTGAQVAPSLAIGGATIGSNALAVTGTANISGATTLNTTTITGGGITFSTFGGVFCNSNNTINIRNTANTADATFTAGAATFSGVLGVSNGAVGAPSIYPAVAANTGIWWRNAAALNLSFSGTMRYEFGSGGDISVGGSGGVGLFMNGVNAQTVNDAGLSRIAAGIIGVGTGAAGNIAGGLQAATLALGGATIGSNALAVTGTTAIVGNSSVIGITTISGAASGNATATFRVFGGLSNSTGFTLTENSTTGATTLLQTSVGGTLAIGSNNAAVLTFAATTNAVAISTSLAIGGATIGSNALAVTGTGAFSGAVSLGNTVNSVSPTSPNRTVTMVIGGTTYYLAAKTTND